MYQYRRKNISLCRFNHILWIYVGAITGYFNNQSNVVTYIDSIIRIIFLTLLIQYY